MYGSLSILIYVTRFFCQATQQKVMLDFSKHNEKVVLDFLKIAVSMLYM